MDSLLDLAGVWLARAYAFYGLAFLVVPAALFADLLLLLAVAWAALSHRRGRQPWPRVPPRVRRWVRLAVEIKFGLINPVLYLAILAPSLMGDRSAVWLTPLTWLAWILLAAFWSSRLFGAALDPESRAVRLGLRPLFAAALACVLLYAVKDAWMLAQWGEGRRGALDFVLNVARVGPLYFIPAVLLWDYLHALGAESRHQAARAALFLMPGRAARGAVAAIAVAALITIGLAVHRRSDGAVRRLVSDHRELIRAAAERYDVDPRLVAAIVYVTHRDQLSPFRGALERLLVTAWAGNLRRDLGILPPDGTGEGADENPLLNRPLDISVGLAQIKPRTAQTASVLATGRKPSDLPKPMFYSYLDVEPVGDRWTAPAAAPRAGSPIPVPASKQTVAIALLEAESNLATCALILALYQHQWEAANHAWSLRARPDILATLYQIGFARSKPHGAPRSNAFGSRVDQVTREPWLAGLLGIPALPR